MTDTRALEANENAIEIRGLRKHFPGFDLGPLNLTVPRGSIYGFVGPNGAGKSTTIDLIFGMGRQDAGSIRVAGLDSVADEVSLKQRAAYVSPELEFLTWGKVRNAIRFVRGFYPGTWDDAYCTTLLDTFQIDPAAKIATLSFGSRIKVALILALARRPEVLVLDEPTTGLDAVAKRELFSQLLSLMEDGGHSILISSHSLGDVERFADRIGIINDGMMLHEGATHEVVGRYCLVDVSLPSGAAFRPAPGLTLIRSRSERIRVLVDTELNGHDHLKQQGADSFEETPLTLEDLFVALMQKPTPGDTANADR
ncbi:MAG: ABC transporter ATP-binding protein [Verrucomicrobiae bacterium]|nr:ABC transporter ATP-binding protein [Verrucomicrobiae bacterium]MCB1088854.1 ABC transporter ATP-binding protein [Verrucomicrobiae bacterium]